MNNSLKFEGDKKNLTSESSIGQEISEAHLDSLKKIIYVKKKKLRVSW